MSSEVKALERRADQYRDYPADLKAAVIQAIENNSGNVLATAKLFNLPRDTVNYWWQHSDRFVEIKQASSEDLAQKLHKIAHSTADSLAEHDLSIVTARDKAAIIQSTVTTRNLLMGLPTQVSETVERQEVTILLQDAISNCLDVTPSGDNNRTDCLLSDSNPSNV